MKINPRKTTRSEGLPERVWKSGKRNRFCAAALVMALTASAVTGCGSVEPMAVPELIEPVGVDVDTVEVKRMNLSSVDSYQGEIVPEIKGLYFVQSGNIDKMYVNVGDKVKKGEVLATLTSVNGNVSKLKKQRKEKQEEHSDANQISQCDIDKAREELSQIEKQLKKAKDPKQREALESQALEKKEDIKIQKLRLKHQKESQALEIRQIDRQLQEAQVQTKNSKLISPVNGEVITTAGGSGYMVQGGATAVNIADMDKPRVRTSYIGSSILGKASSYRAVVNGKEYKVKVEEQEITPFQAEMNEYPDNTWFDFVGDVNLQVGDSATIELYNDTAEDALVVPGNAVLQAKKEHYVYRMEGNSKIKTVVTVGTVTDAYTQILTGLEEGDVVYVQN